ncbi:RHS repeat-associated core domain-containing protein, partial [Acidobacteriota bacterium]
IKFTPTNNLTNNTDYTIKIKAEISDLSGRNLSEFTREFRYISGDLLIYEKEKESEHAESVIENNVLFQGRNYDRITGLYYFRARYFHPQLGRFLQTDPKGYEDSMNMYQSFNQNPVNFVDPYGKGWGNSIFRWIQRKAYVAKSYWKSSDNVAINAIGSTFSDFGGGVGSVFNLGTATGDAISEYGGKKDIESILILSTTIWGEAGEAFLAVYGGYKTFKPNAKTGMNGLDSTKIDNGIYKKPLKERAEEIKKWKRKKGMGKDQMPTPEQYRQFRRAHTPGGKGKTLYSKKSTGFIRMEKKLNKGAQNHHLITKQMAERLEALGMPGEAMRKNKNLIYKSNPGKHIGYEEWHIAYDDHMLGFMRKKSGFTISDLFEEIHKYYQNPEVAKRIPGVNLLQN